MCLRLQQTKTQCGRQVLNVLYSWEFLILLFLMNSHLFPGNIIIGDNATNADYNTDMGMSAKSKQDLHRIIKEKPRAERAENCRPPEQGTPHVVNRSVATDGSFRLLP